MIVDGDWTRGDPGTNFFLPDDSGVGSEKEGDDFWRENLARNVGDSTSFLVDVVTMLPLLLLAARVLAAKRAPNDLRLLRAERGEQEEPSGSSGPDVGESGIESSEMEVPGEFCPLEV